MTQILEVWHVLIGTILTHIEVIELEEAGFCLQFPLDKLSPHLGCFNMFCGLILNQRMLKESLSLCNGKQVS